MSANLNRTSSLFIAGLLLAACKPAGTTGSPPPNSSADVDALVDDAPKKAAPVASPLVKQAESLLAKGDAQGAKTKFEAAIAADASDARAQLGLGLSEETLGDLAAAERAYRRAVELDPKLAEAHNNLALLLRDKGDLQGAISALEQATQADPKLASAQANLALALEDAGQGDAANQAYQHATRLAPADAMLRANYGLFLINQKQNDAAAKELMAGLAQAKGDRAALLALGNGLRRAEKADVAVRALRDAIAAGDGKPSPALLSELSLAQNAAGDGAGAKSSLEQALQLDPKYATAHYLLGSVLAGEGNLKEGAAHYKRVIELAPKSELAQRAKEKLEAATQASKKR